MPENPNKRILIVADMVHPYIYRDAFPAGLGDLDLVLVAGDLPGFYIEFIATRVAAPVVYVHGNHGEEKVKDYLGNETPPGGALNVHGKVLRVAGLVIVGWGGAPRYRQGGDGQYSGLEARVGLGKLHPTLWLNKLRQGRALDIFLTHAPPPGPHAGQDFAHRGCQEIGAFLERYRPALHAHGHVHAYEGKKVEYQNQHGTRIINGYGYQLIELTLPLQVPSKAQALANELRAGASSVSQPPPH
jgi:uncharacterized protein